MRADFPQASLIDSSRFTAQVAVPGVIQGLFSKRVLPVRVAARAHADQFGFQLVQGMVDRAGERSIALKVGKDDALLVHAPGDLEFVLSAARRRRSRPTRRPSTRACRRSSPTP
jgi:hypothetical protein